MKYTKLKKEFINYFVYKSGEKKGFIDTSFDLVWKWITKNFVDKQPKQKSTGTAQAKSVACGKSKNSTSKSTGKGVATFGDDGKPRMMTGKEIKKLFPRPTLQPIENCETALKVIDKLLSLPCGEQIYSKEIRMLFDRINLLSIKIKE